MNLYYSLDKNIQIDILSSDINKLIESYIKENGRDNLLLCVEIKKIRIDSNSLIPKLEYKNSDLTS